MAIFEEFTLISPIKKRKYLGIIIASKIWTKLGIVRSSLSNRWRGIYNSQAERHGSNTGGENE